jgi:cysteine-S-conjugate beta-lyase
MSLFNTPVIRKETSSEKWDSLQRVFGSEDVLPMWVADMDFKVPEAVIEALHRKADHGVFGYSFMSDHYREAVTRWMQRRHNWSITPESIVYAPGVVPAL